MLIHLRLNANDQQIMLWSSCMRLFWNHDSPQNRRILLTHYHGKCCVFWLFLQVHSCHSTYVSCGWIVFTFHQNWIEVVFSLQTIELEREKRITTKRYIESERKLCEAFINSSCAIAAFSSVQCNFSACSLLHGQIDANRSVFWSKCGCFSLVYSWLHSRRAAQKTTAESAYAIEVHLQRIAFVDRLNYMFCLVNSFDCFPLARTLKRLQICRVFVEFSPQSPHPVYIACEIFKHPK